jgi:hypothetical protein
VVYAASIRSCRSCPLRKPRQWQGGTTKKSRQESRLLHPLAVGVAPLLWWDWSRRQHRHACMQLVRAQHIEVRRAPGPPSRNPLTPSILSRAQRAHTRLSWDERLARALRASAEGPVSIKLFGVPDQFADFLGLQTA